MKKSSIYTKTGDKGTTSLVGGTRVKKNHSRLNAYGTIDELNSFVGWLNCSIDDEETRKILSFIQNKLFSVGGHLATESDTDNYKSATIITNEHIKKIEDEMDKMDNLLPKINKFILPGGSEDASRANICRTVCRRAERLIYVVNDEFHIDENILIFVNRLSDYFFLLGRMLNYNKNKEIFWNQEL